jgi:hypothetical protein
MAQREAVLGRKIRGRKIGFRKIFLPQIFLPLQSSIAGFDVPLFTTVTPALQPIEGRLAFVFAAEGQRGRGGDGGFIMKIFSDFFRFFRLSGLGGLPDRH